MKTITIKETRDNLADIIDQVAIAGETFVITKFGKVKAQIIPVAEEKADRLSQEDFVKALKQTSGMWADREDMEDPVAWVNNLRKARHTLP